MLHAYLLHALISWACVFLDSLSLKSVGRSCGVTCLVCFCLSKAGNKRLESNDVIHVVP